MPEFPTVRVNRKAADRIRSGHVWIFSSDVIDRGSAQPGDAVRVIDHKGHGLGVAHYSSTSQITLRLLSRQVEEIGRDFLAKRIQAAYEYRKRIVCDSDAYRLVHAEGDLLPGLIVDRYADWLVLQLLDQGMDRLTADIVSSLRELLEPKGIVARNDLAVRGKENLAQEITVLDGEIPERVPIRMNNLTCEVDLLGGQKTGIFLDQRENYLAVAPVRKRQGTRLLHRQWRICITPRLRLRIRCMRWIARHKHSAPPSANAELNDLQNIDFHEADVLDYLPGLIAAHRSFDIVVVDPPAFAKSRTASGRRGTRLQGN